jgi:glutamine synthetase
MKTILEYVWLGANNELRSKTRVVSEDINFIKQVPSWSFDGSSTEQAPGNHSDCRLRPVKLYPNPFQDDYLVLCEVLVVGGKDFLVGHETNKRCLIHNDSRLLVWV